MKQEQIQPSASQWQPPEKIWNPLFLSIFFANMMLVMGQQMSNNLLAKYADSMGASAAEVGMIISSFAIAALCFRFLAGPLINSFNRRVIAMVSISVMAISFVGFGISDSTGSLMVFRLVQGMGNAFASVCCLAMVSDVLPRDKFNAGMGYFSCAQVISQAIGPTVGLQLADWFGYNITYFINAGMLLIAVLLASRVRLAPQQPRKFRLNPSEMFAKEAVIPALIVLFVAMGYTTINSFLVVYAAKQGVENGIGLFFTVYALTMLVTRPLIGKLTDRYGFVKVGIPSLLMTILSLILIGYSTKLWVFLLAAFVNAFGYGALQPALQSLCVQSVPASRRGSGSGTFYIGLDAATLFGPTVAGMVADRLGYVPAMWNVMAIPLLIGIGIIFLARKPIRAIENGFSK